MLHSPSCTGFDLDALLVTPVAPAKSKVSLHLPKDQTDASSKQLQAPSPSGLEGLTSSDSLLRHGQKRSTSLHCTAVPPENSGPIPTVAIVVHKPEADESELPAPSLSSLSSCSKEAEGGKEEEEVGDRATGPARKSLASSTGGWRPVSRALVRDSPPEVSGSVTVDIVVHTDGRGDGEEWREKQGEGGRSVRSVEGGGVI